jgi:hypothetical protein
MHRREVGEVREAGEAEVRDVFKLRYSDVISVSNVFDLLEYVLF